MKHHAVNFAVGALGGGIMVLGAWFVVSKLIDRQFAAGSLEIVSRAEIPLREVMNVEIPRRVAETIDQKLSEAGITRQTGEQIAILMQQLEGLGILQAPQNGGGA